ncbi:eukaryotic translation initiation factor 4E [Trapelia coarctata]|nr:eukaryotic translation initiation factor 4E [Trapelia coarctata]
MTNLNTPGTEANKPSSPVPLDTIPISPEGGKAADENAPPNGSAPKREYKDSEQITVFHDPDNFNVKHPLMNNWTLWFTKPPSGKGDNWNDLLKEVVTFDSVEEFWGVFNNITPTSELAVKSDYHLFKKGVRPEWEDPQNKHGGKWSYSYREKKNVPIDENWLYVMLAAIGETLENDGDGEVMGVVVNVRKGFYRIGVWTKTVGKPVPGGGEGDVAGGKGRSADKSKEVLMGIGRKFKDVLKLDASEVVEFSGHTESAHSGSTRAKAKFTV